MINYVIEIVLALAVITQAVLWCAAWKRQARVEREVFSSLLLHNRRIWKLYHTLRWHVMMPMHMNLTEKELAALDYTFNKESENKGEADTKKNEL